VLRRLVPLTLLSATAVLVVPSTASAAPAEGPVGVSHLDSYYASASVPLPTGETAVATLLRYRYTGDMTWHDDVMVTLGTPCGGGQQLCGGTDHDSGEVADDQVVFGADLRAAGVTAPITLRSYDGATGETREISASLTFTGTGAISRTSYGSTNCAESGEPGCHSRREEATRAADVTVSIGNLAGTGTGTLFHGLDMDVTPPHAA
jgi:hypothetical protein